jgi:hypothetical protein
VQLPGGAFITSIDGLDIRTEICGDQAAVAANPYFCSGFNENYKTM